MANYQHSRVFQFDKYTSKIYFRIHALTVSRFVPHKYSVIYIWTNLSTPPQKYILIILYGVCAR